MLRTGDNNSQNSTLQSNVNNGIIENNNPKRTYTEQERTSAIMRYKSGDAYTINAKLREDMELDDSDQEFVEALNEGLLQLPTYEGTVYRNLTFDDFGDGKEAINEFLEQHRQDEMIIYNQFISCSTKIDGYPVEGKHKVSLIIESKSARNVEGYGNNNESEVIYPLKSAFIVDKVDLNGEYPIIYLQEVSIDGHNTTKEQGDAVQHLQESYSKNDNLQGVSERDTLGNFDREIRPQPSTPTGQWDALRSEGRQDSLLSAESVEQENEVTTHSDTTNTSEGGEGIASFGGIDTESGKHLNKAQQDEVRAIGEKLGRKVEFEDFYKLDKFKGKKKIPDGYIDKDGNIHINFYAKRPVYFLFKHEITHYLKRAKFSYQDFMNRVIGSNAFKNWLSDKGYSSIDELKAEIMDTYSEVEGFNEDKCYDEILADFVGERLFGGKNKISQDLINALEPKQRKTFLDVIKDIIEFFKRKFSDNARISSEIESIEKEFIKVYNEAVEVKTDSSFDSDEQFSIAKTTENVPVVVVNDDILQNAVDEKEVVSIVKKSLGRFKRVPIHGQSIYFISDTKNEYTNSNYSKYLRKNDKQTYQDKMRLAAHPQDIIYATTDYINEGLNHPRKDNIIDFARGNILIDVSGRKYSAEVVIGFTKRGICELHDIVKMESTKFEYKKEATSESMDSKESTRSDATSNNKIPQTKDFVNNNSMQETDNYSIPSQNSAEDLLYRYESGEITRQQYLDMVKKEKTLKVGESGKAYVNKRSSDEFAYPANRRMDNSIKETKMRTATELDNLLSVSQFIEHQDDDGRHPEATGGWDVYSTRFEVGGNMFVGEVKIMITNRGYVFYDVTKIRRTTRNGGLTENNSAAASGNPSTDSINDNQSTVKNNISDEGDNYSCKVRS